MGPGRSSSLRIGGDSLVVVSTGGLGASPTVRLWLNSEMLLGHFLFP